MQSLLIEDHDVIQATVSRDKFSQHLKVLDKQGKLVYFIPNKAQKYFRANKQQRNLIVKSRQIGISTDIQAEMILDAMTTITREAVLAHDAVTTALLRRMSKRFWTHLPEHIRPKRSEDNATTTVYATTGAEVTIATAGSLDIGRGGTFNRVHGTEVAFWKDADKTLAGLLQGVPPNGQVDLESTANGAQGYFYEKCMEALDGSQEFGGFFFFPWFWDEGYYIPFESKEEEEEFQFTEAELELVNEHDLSKEQINWRRRKQVEIPLTFDQEYPEDVYTAFIQSGNSVFGDITPFINAEKVLTPVEGHRNVAGGDWGQTNDFSGISIIDSTTNQEIYLDRYNKMNWDEMQWRMVNACIFWEVETFQPEKNSASSNVEGLKNKFESKGYDINLRPITTTNDKKRKWVTNLYRALHNEGLQLLSIPYANSELRSFVQKQTANGAYVYEAAGSAHDDTVIMRLLANDAKSKLLW